MASRASLAANRGPPSQQLSNLEGVRTPFGQAGHAITYTDNKSLLVEIINTNVTSMPINIIV